MVSRWLYCGDSVVVFGDSAQSLAAGEGFSKNEVYINMRFKAT